MLLVGVKLNSSGDLNGNWSCWELVLQEGAKLVVGLSESGACSGTASRRGV